MSTGRHHRAQSAMEYLMTYGWAILVIAVVLGVLYSLGIFNGIGTVPRAQPGNCQVYRPSGPGSGQNTNLVGTCGGVLPEFVAQFNAGNVTIPNNRLLQVNAMTISAWVQLAGYPSGSGNGVDGEIVDKISYCAASANDFPYQLFVTPAGQVQYWVSSGSSYSDQAEIASNTDLSIGAWYNVVATYNGAVENLYINGAPAASPITYGNAIAANNEPLEIGSVAYNEGDGCGSQKFFNGIIADVQVYNASLSQTEISALYNGGIGGAPIRTQNLVGWWPLNGNANDYSGNSNNGQSSAVHYVSNWTRSYPIT